ncbi:MAG TPA: S-layer homology domain-containing protein [Anaerovoracaceae bacterium]|nr:S-layer homology domain-containing protein [Anaerovoracaceae bacterium]
MRKVRTILSLVMIIVLLGASACYAGAPAEGYELYDGKYVKAESGYYWQGRYSDGRLFSEYLAKELTGDFDNLVNYAVGGAFSGVLTGSAEDGTDRSNWSTWLKGWGGIDQTERFLGDVNGLADPDALYVISVGANDSYTEGTLGLEGSVQKSASNIVTMIDNLAKAGATDFIVMLQDTTPGKTESDFTKAHRAAAQKAVSDYIAGHKDYNIVMVDTDYLYRNMEGHGKEAYGFKTWGFYQISDWVPAYGYAYAADDNSKILPTNAAEDIYGYGYYYSTDSAYYTPEVKDYAVDEFLYYDEYHLASKTQKHKATYILNKDIDTDNGVFKKVYDGTPSAFAESPMAKKTYSTVYTFGDSTIDSGRALEVTSRLVNARTTQHTGIGAMKDAEPKEWYSTYVNYALMTGMIYGTEADTFDPDRAMTRAEFITILGRAGGIKDSSAASPVKTVFADVDPTEYYASHVAWAVQKGLINAAGGAFLPGDKISRQDVAEIVGVFAENTKRKLPETESGFTFGDDSAITRAEAVSLLVQVLNYGTE